MSEINYKRRLKNKLIEYRDTLNLSNDITFGIEIEYENIPFDSVSCYLDFERNFNPNFNDWINEMDLDLNVYNRKGEMMNGEIISPILRDNATTWKNLKIALDILKNNNAIITEQCGGHVNIGAHILEDNEKYFRNLLLLWLLYEKEIYDFSSGEYSKVRVRDDSMNERISSVLNKNLEYIGTAIVELYEYLNNLSIFDKMYDLSLLNVYGPIFYPNNRIEIRVPNGSLNEEIWQNNINFFSKLLIACKNDLDIDKILYKIKKNQHSPEELADLIFKDQIDKDNFLIQTLKTNKVYKKELPKHIIY